MKVKELIALLLEQDQEAEILLKGAYGSESDTGMDVYAEDDLCILNTDLCSG